MSMSMIQADYSKSNDFYDCPRKYYLKYIKKLESIYGNTALRAGSAFHAGMEGFYSHVKDHGWKRGEAMEKAIHMASLKFEQESGSKTFISDYRTIDTVVEVLLKYFDHFHADESMLSVRHTERAFKLLITPTKEDERNFPWIKPFYFVGKIDQEINLNGFNWTNEFKTTGWSLSGVTNELTRSPQIIGYAYASKHVYDVMPNGCMVTVAYFKANKLKSGGYGKLSIDFSRVPQIYNDYDLKDWRRHFISLVAQMQLAYETEHFPPRFQNCYKFGRCTFLNICEQSMPLEKASLYGYEVGEGWNVLEEVGTGKVMEGKENV